MKIILMIIVGCFFLILLALELYAFLKFIPNRLGNNKNNIQNLVNFRNKAKLIKGIMVNYIVFTYNQIVVDSDLKPRNSTFFIELPIVKINNESKLVSCSPLDEFKSLGETRFNYNNLNSAIELYIDETKLGKLNINLEQGLFLNKNYPKIKRGLSEEVKTNLFTNEIPKELSNNMNGEITEAKMYLANDVDDIESYLSEIMLAPGIVSKINNIDIMIKNEHSINKLLKIIGLICVGITIIIFLIIFRFILKF